MRDLLERSGKRELSTEEIQRVGAVLLQGPTAQQLKRTEGREAGLCYASKLLAKVQQVVEREQTRDSGMEL